VLQFVGSGSENYGIASIVMNIEHDDRPRPWKVLKNGGAPQRPEKTLKPWNSPDMLEEVVPLTREPCRFKGFVLQSYLPCHGLVGT
jgi:hypothetical protein